jgi:hypothetical protein
MLGLAPQGDGLKGQDHLSAVVVYEIHHQFTYCDTKRR